MLASCIRVFSTHFIHSRVTSRLFYKGSPVRAFVFTLHELVGDFPRVLGSSITSCNISHWVIERRADEFALPRRRRHFKPNSVNNSCVNFYLSLFILFTLFYIPLQTIIKSNLCVVRDNKVVSEQCCSY